MKRVAILGATGRAGREFVYDALSGGLDVRVLTRHPASLTQANERLTVFQGSALDAADLETALGGCHFVISAMDTRAPIQALSMATVVDQLQGRRGRALEKVFLLSPLCRDDEARSPAGGHSLSRRLYRMLHRARLEDFERAERTLSRSGLPFAIVGPGQGLQMEEEVTLSVASLSAPRRSWPGHPIASCS